MQGKFKLALKKETITKLSDDQMKKIIGGTGDASPGTASCDNNSCNSTGSGSCHDHSCNCTGPATPIDEPILA